MKSENDGEHDVFMSAKDKDFSDGNQLECGSMVSDKRKVIHRKLICYVSAFHLNVNDWFSEYENIEIFNMNLQKELGKYIH